MSKFCKTLCPTLLCLGMLGATTALYAESAQRVLTPAKVEPVLEKNDKKLQHGSLEFLYCHILSPEVFRALRQGSSQKGEPSQEKRGDAGKEFRRSYEEQFHPRLKTLVYDDRGNYRLLDQTAEGADSWEEFYDGAHLFRTTPESKVIGIFPVKARSYGEDTDEAGVTPQKSYGLGHGLSSLTSLRVLSEDADTVTITGMSRRNSLVQATLSKKQNLLATHVICYWTSDNPSSPPRIRAELTFSHPQFVSKSDVWINTECTIKFLGLGAKVTMEDRYQIKKADFVSNFPIQLPKSLEKWTLSDGRLAEPFPYDPGTWKMRDLDTVILKKTQAYNNFLRQSKNTNRQSLVFWAITSLVATMFCVFLVRGSVRTA